MRSYVSHETPISECIQISHGMIWVRRQNPTSLQISGRDNACSLDRPEDISLYSYKGQFYIARFLTTVVSRQVIDVQEDVFNMMAD